MPSGTLLHKVQKQRPQPWQTSNSFRNTREGEMKIVCPYLCFHVPISSESFENPNEINEIALLTTLWISSFFRTHLQQQSEVLQNANSKQQICKRSLTETDVNIYSNIAYCFMYPPSVPERLVGLVGQDSQQESRIPERTTGRSWTQLGTDLGSHRVANR